MSEVKVLYPEGENEREWMYRDWTREEVTSGPGKLVEVFSMACEEMGHDAAELAYSVCNSSPDEMYGLVGHEADVARWAGNRQRSMSVGDVVEVDGVRWICESMGFRALVDEEIEGIDLVYA